MSTVARVTVHPSQFPEAVRRDLLTSLRRRQVNHKFHYDSARQTQQWLALHQHYSPSRHDADCEAIYDQAFAAVADPEDKHPIHLIGFGCGGGQKDTRLLKLLQSGGRKVSYTPSDVSVAMTLVARQTALTVIGEADCTPFVCDLAMADDLHLVLNSISPAKVRRLVTFFGMIPNFEPAEILPRLAACLSPGEPLLFSANLAPGTDYQAGVERVLPQYDNALTRDWLLTFLLDLGVERSDGEVRFCIETDVQGFKRIVARYFFSRNCTVSLDGERVEFCAGENIRLFFSCRYTPANLAPLLVQHRLVVHSKWVTRSAEEGVFLCFRQAAPSAAAP